MKVLKYIFIGLFGIIVLALIGGLVLPSHYEVKQSIVINAPVSAVFEKVNNLKQWQYWSPWQLTDPDNIISYEGSISGVGCKMVWNSKNSKIGQGSQEIIISEPNKHIKTLLSFKGWNAVTYASWNFEEKEWNKTKVTWAYNTQIGGNILYKYMAVMMRPIIGKEYNKGLQKLKLYLERL